MAASTIGTFIESYDFFVNASAAAPVFGPLFFPTSAPTVSPLAALSVFAFGYLARPFGGIVFGHFGDRVGRKSMLVLSIPLMALVSWSACCRRISRSASIKTSDDARAVLEVARASAPLAPLCLARRNPVMLKGGANDRMRSAIVRNGDCRVPIARSRA